MTLTRFRMEKVSGALPITLFSFALLLISFSGYVEATPHRYLLALSKTDHTLAIIEPKSLTVLERIPVGPNPHEIVTSTDGRYAFVSNPGNNNLHQIDVIDLVHRKSLPPIDTSPLLAPHGMQFVGGKLWFTAQGSKSIGRIDPVTRTVEWTLGTGQNFTHLIYVTEDQKRIYTTNALSGTVSIFNCVLKQPNMPPSGKLPPNAKPYWDWEHTLVKVPLGSEGFDVSPDGKELWTVSAQGQISIIEPKKKQLVTTLNTDIMGAHRLKFTKEGPVIIVSVKTGDVVYFDSQSRSEIGRIRVAPGDTIAVDDIGNRLFVSCPLDNIVTVIDNKTMKVASLLNVGGRPDGLAFVSVPE